VPSFGGGQLRYKGEAISTLKEISHQFPEVSTLVRNGGAPPQKMEGREFLAWGMRRDMPLEDVEFLMEGSWITLPVEGCRIADLASTET